MDEIALYIHWPYCARICPYCDFNIYKNKPDKADALVDAILADMKYWREWSGPRRLVSIHFGGGTPSLLSAQNLGRIIDRAANLWCAARDMEVGLEANPKDIDAQSLTGWRAAGIERLSVGVQSFDGWALAFLGRDHTGQAAKSALELAATVMPRISADLIYGWTNQTLGMLERDLHVALDSEVSHVSAYQLTIEPGTAFGKAQARGVHKAVNSDMSADMFELKTQILSEAGFEQYEVSNFAKNKAARSRHNLVYWQGGDYIGVGPGAHGRLTIDGVRSATIAAHKPKDYIEQTNALGDALDSALGNREILSPKSWGAEYLLMGLRITDGISLARYRQISGTDLAPDRISQFEHAGLLKASKDRLSATAQGRLVLDSLCRGLLS